jgi:hypothetical protein
LLIITFKKGTPLFEGVDFKQAIARTPAFVGKFKEENRSFYIYKLMN